MAQDPLCGMTVNEARAKHTVEHEGRTYFFCSGGCRKTFLLQPEKYLSPEYRPTMWGGFVDWLRAVARRPKLR